MKQGHEDMRNAENVGSTTTEPKKMIQEMMIAIGDCLSDLAGSNNEEDGEDDDDEDTELGKLSEDEEPGWVVGTKSKTVPQRLETFWQTQMKLDELTQSGSGEVADYFCETHIK